MVNKVELLGYVGQDPECKSGDKWISVKFSMATTEGYRDKKITTWHKVIAWGKLAEIAEMIVKKGSLVYVEGKIKDNKYTKRTGETVAEKIIEAQKITVIPSKTGQSVPDEPQQEEPKPSGSERRYGYQAPDGTMIPDDDDGRPPF